MRKHTSLQMFSTALMVALVALPSLCYAGEGRQNSKQSYDQEVLLSPAEEKTIVPEAQIQDLKAEKIDPRLQSLSMSQASIARYGFNLVNSKDEVDNTNMIIRAGVSRLNANASAGVQMIVNW